MKGRESEKFRNGGENDDTRCDLCNPQDCATTGGNGEQVASVGRMQTDSGRERYFS